MFLFDPQKNLRYCLYFITDKKDAENLSYLTYFILPETVKAYIDIISDLKISVLSLLQNLAIDRTWWGSSGCSLRKQHHIHGNHATGKNSVNILLNKSSMAALLAAF